MPTPALQSIPDAARYMGIRQKAVRELIAGRYLETREVLGRVYVTTASINEYCRPRSVTPVAPQPELEVDGCRNLAASWKPDYAVREVATSS